MSNRFGINSTTNTGDNNPTVADASETETTQKPFTGLNFNSVVSSSFNSALTDADQVLKTQAVAPAKPDNSSFLSMGGNFLGGTVNGLAEQVTTVFKKDKATLAREADQGGISALTSGHSISAAFTRTAGEVAHAVPALNPFTADGRKNLGILGNKYVEGWTTGTADDKARFAGTNFSFILSMGIGGGTAVKSGSAVARDLRGGTMASRAAILEKTAIAGQDELATVARQFAHVGENGVGKGHAIIQDAKVITAATEQSGLLQSVSRVTEGLKTKGSTLFQDAKAATLNVGDGIGTRVTNLTDRFSITGPSKAFISDTRPATSAAITDLSKAATTKAVNHFDSAVSSLLVKGETPLLQEVKSATEALIANKPGSQSRFLEALEKSGNAELISHGNQVVRSVERAGSVERLGVVVDEAVQSAGTKLEALKGGLTKGSEGTKAIQSIERLLDDAARNGTKTDELVQAVNALKKDVPGLNPQLVDGLIGDVAKLETAATNRRLLTSFDGAVAHVDEAATSFQKVLEDARKATLPPSGSSQFDAFEKLKVAADDLAKGKITPQKFAADLDELARVGNVPAKSLEAVVQQAANLTEKVNVTNLFSHMDDLVKPVKTATSELEPVLLKLSETSPEQVAKVRQAFADFAAGRTGNAEELTAAVRNLANNEKTVATQAGKDVLAVTKLTDDLAVKSGEFVQAVEKARPALTMEKYMAESAPILEEAAAKWANNPTHLKAIEEVQAAFNGAFKGNVTADELAQVINKNSRSLERAIEGSTDILKANGTKIADAAVDSSRALAIKNGLTDLSKASDEVVTAVKGLKTQFADDAAKAASLQKLEDAVTAFKTAPAKTEELTTKLQTAIQEARQAEIPFTKHMDEFAATVERTGKLQTLETSVAKTRQASNNIIATTDLMEAAVRQGEQFQAIERLKTAVRTGDTTKINEAFAKAEVGLAELEKVQPGITKQIMADVAKASDGNSSALTRLTRSLDEAETIAKRSSSEFKAIEEVRASARLAAADGVGDDLARVVKKNEAQLVALQEKVAAMETKVAGVESKATNLVQKLTDDVAVLGNESAKVRQLNNIENASRSVTNVVDNLGTKLDDAARISGNQVAKDMRAAAARAGDDVTKAKLIAEAEKLEGKTTQLAKEVEQLAASASDDATRTRYLAKAEELKANPSNFNNVSERLNIFKSASDDVARGTIKEAGLTEFAKRSTVQLDEAFGKGTGKLVESKVAELANAQKLVVARESIDAARKLPSIADEAARLGFKADSEVGKLATEYNTALRNFTHNNGTLNEVNSAAQKLRDFKGAEVLTESLERSQKAAHTMNEARWAAFETQFKAYENAARLNNVYALKTTLNQIGNMYDIMPPVLQNQFLKLREHTLNAWAAKLVQEQGFYGPNTIAQSRKFRIAELTKESALPEVREAGAIVSRNIAENQVKFSVRGLTQDRTALLANPNLAQEAMARQLRNDILKTAAGLGAFGLGAWTLKEKAQDTVYAELNAPYKIAEWMEKEISAKTEADRERYRAELATMVANYIRNKDQSEIDALREQIKNIIAERTAENPEAQAVWTRRKEALTVGQLRVKKEYENQVQYGNAHGPNRGPGAPSSVQEVAQQVFMAQPARVRSTAISNFDQDGNKRKPATTNFDINKIRDMSNNIAYSQSGLRANPMGTAGQTSLANAYTPGSTKAWQNVVSWNTGRKFASGEPSGKHVYGNFSHMEEQPENDQAGMGGGTVAQGGPGHADPATAALQLAAAQGQKQQQANQDENATTTTV